MSEGKTSVPSGTREERLNYYATEALPNSLKNISENSKNLTPVIEYLEQSYLRADSQQAKDDVEKEAQGYLVDALKTVVGDISTTARNLEQFVELQVDAVDGLSTQVDLLKTKMALYKEQHGSEKFHGYRDNIITASGTYKRKLDEEELKKTNAKLSSVLVPAVHQVSDLSSGEEKKEEDGEQSRKVTANKRVPLSERFARFDDVGECLDKESDKIAAKNEAMKSSSVLRRSSYNKATMRRLSQPGENDDETVSSGMMDDDDDVSVSTQGSKPVAPPRLSSAKH